MNHQLRNPSQALHVSSETSIGLQIRPRVGYHPPLSNPKNRASSSPVLYCFGWLSFFLLLLLFVKFWFFKVGFGLGEERKKREEKMDHEADAYRTDLMTMTRFVLNEQSKHPESRGDFTILLSHIVLGCKFVCSAVNKVSETGFV